MEFCLLFSLLPLNEPAVIPSQSFHFFLIGPSDDKWCNAGFVRHTFFASRGPGTDLFLA